MYNNVAVDRVVESVVRYVDSISIFFRLSSLSERERPGRRFAAENFASARSHVGADCRTVTIGVEKLRVVGYLGRFPKTITRRFGPHVRDDFRLARTSPTEYSPSALSSKALACVYAVIFFFFFFFNRYTSPVLLSYRSIFARYGSPSARTKR